MIRSVSVYFWYILFNASNSQGIQEQAQSTLHLLPTKLFPLSLCPSIFLYHFVTYIFKLSTVSVRLRQTHACILSLTSVVLYFWRHTPPHISVRRTFIPLVRPDACNRCTSLYSSGCLRRLSSRVPRWQEQPESQRRTWEKHTCTSTCQKNWEWCF